MSDKPAPPAPVKTGWPCKRCGRTNEYLVIICPCTPPRYNAPDPAPPAPCCARIMVCEGEEEFCYLPFGHDGSHKVAGMTIRDVPTPPAPVEPLQWVRKYEIEHARAKRAEAELEACRANNRNATRLLNDKDAEIATLKAALEKIAICDECGFSEGHRPSCSMVDGAEDDNRSIAREALREKP